MTARERERERKRERVLTDKHAGQGGVRSCNGGWRGLADLSKIKLTGMLYSNQTHGSKPM